MKLPAAILLFAFVTTSVAAQPAPSAAIPLERFVAVDTANSAVSALHAAAARADGPAYFALFAPDAVFIGTDVSERWTLAEFRAYADPLFASGRGWTYVLRGPRHIFLSADQRTAWFDEVLDSANYGTSRGTGVLVWTSGGWRIAQYHLTFPIPNALAPEFTRRIREHEGRAAATSAR